MWANGTLWPIVYKKRYILWMIYYASDRVSYQGETSSLCKMRSPHLLGWQLLNATPPHFTSVIPYLKVKVESFLLPWCLPYSLILLYLYIFIYTNNISTSTIKWLGLWTTVECYPRNCSFHLWTMWVLRLPPSKNILRPMHLVSQVNSFLQEIP